MSAPITVHTSRLSPLSVGTVSQIQLGSDELQQVELIQLLQNAYAFSNPTEPLPSPGVVISRVQEGTDTRPDIQRITLSPIPYGGTFNFTLAGDELRNIPFDIKTPDLQSLVGASYIVAKKAANAWQITTVADGSIDLITADGANLIVPTGVSGVLGLNVIGIWLSFVGNTKKVNFFTVEVQLQFPGEDPQTIFQDTVEMSRNVINLATLRRSMLLGFQTSYSDLLSGNGFTYTNAITGLRGGSTNLDAVTTAEKTIGYRYDFPLNDFVNSFILAAGAADPADPTGQVAPLDYDAASNNKHWERGA